MKHSCIFILISVCAAVAAFSSCEERIRLDDNGKSLILNAAHFEMSDASSTYLTDQYPFPSNVKGGLGYVCIFSDCEYVVSLPDRIQKY